MRIVIADPDSSRQRRAFDSLSGVPDVQVSLTCGDLSEAFNAVEHRPPHLALFAAQLTRLPEFEAMETLCRHLSVRWMIFGFGECVGSQISNALNLSASEEDVVDVLNWRMKGRTRPVPSSPAGLFKVPVSMGSDQIVLIGSSTGGVDALLQVLGAFPANCPPTLVVQHTGASFSAGLARLLDSRVDPKVVEAEDGALLSSGTVMIAPGSETHLVLDDANGVRCRLEAGEKMCGHRPSVDALFKSAVDVAHRAVGVILTGMGRDGAEGLLDLRRAGAETIAQDAATSLVYGMPGAAAKIGAVEHVLPLSAVGPAILKASRARRI